MRISAALALVLTLTQVGCARKPSDEAVRITGVLAALPPDQRGFSSKDECQSYETTLHERLDQELKSDPKGIEAAVLECSRSGELVKWAADGRLHKLVWTLNYRALEQADYARASRLVRIAWDLGEEPRWVALELTRQAYYGIRSPMIVFNVMHALASDGVTIDPLLDVLLGPSLDGRAEVARLDGVIADAFEPDGGFIMEADWFEPRPLFRRRTPPSEQVGGRETPLALPSRP
jgi:hypothetical protein